MLGKNDMLCLLYTHHVYNTVFRVTHRESRSVFCLHSKAHALIMVKLGVNYCGMKAMVNTSREHCTVLIF